MLFSLFKTCVRHYANKSWGGGGACRSRRSGGDGATGATGATGAIGFCAALIFMFMRSGGAWVATLPVAAYPPCTEGLLFGLAFIAVSKIFLSSTLPKRGASRLAHTAR